MLLRFSKHACVHCMHCMEGVVMVSASAVTTYYVPKIQPSIPFLRVHDDALKWTSALEGSAFLTSPGGNGWILAEENYL